MKSLFPLHYVPQPRAVARINSRLQQQTSFTAKRRNTTGLGYYLFLINTCWQKHVYMKITVRSVSAICYVNCVIGKASTVARDGGPRSWRVRIYASSQSHVPGSCSIRPHPQYGNKASPMSLLRPHSEKFPKVSYHHLPRSHPKVTPQGLISSTYPRNYPISLVYPRTVWFRLRASSQSQSLHNGHISCSAFFDGNAVSIPFFLDSVYQCILFRFYKYCLQYERDKAFTNLKCVFFI